MAVKQKEFIKRTDIKTMRKDIKQAREADAFRESEKIIAPETKKEPAKVNHASATQTQPTSQQNREAQVAALEKTEQHADEAEKQKIFLLKSQKAELGNRLQAIVKERQNLETEKSNLQIEQKKWREKLIPLLSQEKTASENQKDAIEKQKWPIEQTLVSQTNKINDIDQRYNELAKQEETVTLNVSEINRSLEELYNGILKRQVSQKNSPIEKPSVSPQAPPTQMDKGKETMDKEESPAMPRATPTSHVNKEEEQRKRFMEDIEKWASSN